ncbi:MAG: divalent-cation tolerance protein CutA [Thermoanaerobaculia bacterium]|nr:divalent-cation tolerance protein CutA [Thermoanaerobaculia bacterium]
MTAGAATETGASLVWINTPDRRLALAIGRELVGERLAGAVNVIDGVLSIHRWQGSVVETGEAVLVVKTRSDRVEAVVERVLALHSYACPCVVAVPIVAGSPEYLEWLATEAAE